MKTKLKEYLDDHGIMIRWFAGKLGVQTSCLSAFINGNIPMATKHWTKVVLLTKGEVTLEDILEMHNEYNRTYEKKRKQFKYKDSRKLSQIQKAEQKQEVG